MGIRKVVRPLLKPEVMVFPWLKKKNPLNDSPSPSHSVLCTSCLCYHRNCEHGALFRPCPLCARDHLHFSKPLHLCCACLSMVGSTCSLEMVGGRSQGFGNLLLSWGKINGEWGWIVLKNWCFWTVVLEKTLESPLDSREIKPVNPKGNQHWIFIGKTDAEGKAPKLWPPDVKSLLIRRYHDAGNDWRWEEKGTTEEEMVGWHHRLNGCEFEQTPGDSDGQGSLMCCSSWGRKELEMTEQLNNNKEMKRPWWPGNMGLDSTTIQMWISQNTTKSMSPHTDLSLGPLGMFTPSLLVRYLPAEPWPHQQILPLFWNDKRICFYLLVFLKMFTSFPICCQGWQTKWGLVTCHFSLSLCIFSPH